MKITKNSLSIVTGASGGLGSSIADSILSFGGKLLFVARNEEKIKNYEAKIENNKIPSFFKLKIDLVNSYDLEVFKDYLEEFLMSNPEISEIFLFNNASSIEPIALISEVSFEDISNALILNIASSYCISAFLINIGTKYKISRINIINISSGVSINPVKGWSSYCISKAGLNMLSKCIATENNFDTPFVFSLSINPGPIDTEMQKKIRSANSETIPAVKKFEAMFNEGKLQKSDDVSAKLFTILASDNFSNGDFIDFNSLNTNN